MKKTKKLSVKADAQIFRFWNDTQDLTMIIEDKINLPDPPIEPPIEPELPNIPTNIRVLLLDRDLQLVTNIKLKE